MPAYAKKLWKVINDHFLRHYTLLLIRSTPDMKVADLVAKSKKEITFIMDVFAGNLTQRDTEEANKFKGLYIQILTEPPDGMIKDIVALSIKLKDEYDDKILVGVMSSRKSYARQGQISQP